MLNELCLQKACANGARHCDISRMELECACVNKAFQSDVWECMEHRCPEEVEGKMHFAMD